MLVMDKDVFVVYKIDVKNRNNVVDQVKCIVMFVVFCYYYVYVLDNLKYMD